MSFVKCFSDTNSAVSHELGKLKRLVRDCEIDKADACLVDFQQTSTETAEWLDSARQANKPIILLNVPEGATIPGCVALIKTRAAILIFEDDYTILNVLDTPAGPVTGAVDSVSVDLEKRTFSDVVTRQLEGPSNDISDEALALAIEAAIAPSAVYALRAEMAATHESQRNANDLLEDVSVLPYPQYKKQYVHVGRSFLLLETNQTYHMNALYEFALFASYDKNGASKKHLRMVTLRSAQEGQTVFSAGNLNYNGTYKRGAFVESVTYSSSSNNSSILHADVTPPLVGSGAYNGIYSVAVGVDTSKYVHYQQQYTIGSYMSFDCGSFLWAGRGSAPLTHHFTTSYGNCWNMFDQPFFQKAQVKGVPNKPNGISPLCQRRYECAATFSGTASISYGIQTRLAEFYVTGNWLSYEMHYTHWQCDASNLSFNINFGEVSC